MKKGRICKKSIQMNGFSKHEANAVVQCIKDVFPGSYAFIKQMQDNNYLLTIVPPAVLTPLAFAHELFTQFNIKIQS